LDLHVDAAAFDKIPMAYPSPCKAAGQSVMLVSSFRGLVRSTLGITVGSKVEHTDLFTAAGLLILSNSDPWKMEADLSVVRKMEKAGLFELDEGVGPAQFEDPDSAWDMGRRRASTLDSFPPRPSPAAAEAEASDRSSLLVAVAALADGVLIGFLAGRRAKQ